MPPTVAEKTWENCLTHISDRIPTQSFRTWFASITPLELAQGQESAMLTLGVPDAFHTEWLESHYAHVIRQAAADVVGRHTDVAFEIAPDQDRFGSEAQESIPEHGPHASPRYDVTRDSPHVDEELGPRHGAGLAVSYEHRGMHVVPRDYDHERMLPQHHAGERTPPHHQNGGGTHHRDGAATHHKNGGRQFPDHHTDMPSYHLKTAPVARHRYDGAPAHGEDPQAIFPHHAGNVRPSLHESRTRAPMVIESRLKPEYRFDSFIEGDCNRLARSAAVAIARNPGGTSFNPFLVYGGVGLGKTHIVQAVGNEVVHHGKAERVRYVSSEQFTSQFVRSIQENRISDFSSFYRQVDLLIVDDVQFFGGKEKTQEEFFHVFNELHQAGKQIILCADRPPSEISGIEERLLSRFRWGLSADIQAPDFETRIAILQRKAAEHKVSLCPEVAEFVAERIRANIRQLEGALLRLSAHAALEERSINLDAAKEILRDMMEDYQVRLEIEDIQRAIAQFYGLSPELLSAKTRKREVVTARHVAMYLSKQFTSHSLKSIGLRFGGRDHSTVIHACGAIEDRMELEPGFREEIDEIQRRMERQASSRIPLRHRSAMGIA